MKKFQKYLIALLACSFVTTSMLGLTSCALLTPPTAAEESSSSSEAKFSSAPESIESIVPEESSSEVASSEDTLCEHIFEFETVIEPTCEEAGLKTEICQNPSCGETRNSAEIEKLGHEWMWGEDVVFDAENPDDKYTGDYCARCYQTTSQNLEYRLDTAKKEAYLKAVGNCTDDKFYLPSKIEVNGVEYAVKGIDGAFCGYSFMKRFEIVDNAVDGFVIADEAFCYSYGLKEVLFNNVVTALGNNTFLNCEALENVEVGNRLETMGNNAFYGCGALKEISLPATLKGIGDHAFESCTTLTKVVIGEEAVTNALEYIGVQAFASNPALVDIQIYEGVKEIGEGAFSKNESLKKIVLPDTLETIGNYVFSDCINLEEVRIGILMGNSKTATIETYAFANCPALKTVYIPETLTLVGEGVFEGSAISNVYISSVKAWCEIEFATAEVNPLYQGVATLYVNDEKMTDVVIDDETVRVENYAFYNYKNMTSLTIGENVETIGKQAFAGCSNLERIAFNATYAKALTLETEAFAYAGYVGKDENGNKIYKSIEVEVGANVSMIPAYLFATESTAFDYKTPSIKKVTFAQDSKCTKIGDYAFYCCDQLTDVTFGYYKEIESQNEEVESTYEFVSTLTTIGSGAFMYCENLQSAVFGGTMKTINDEAFFGCSNLKYVEIPDNFDAIAEDSFAGCFVEKVVYPAKAIDYIYIYDLKDVTITTGEIIESQYHSTYIEKLTIGAGVTSIGEMAFAYTSIKELNLENATSLATIGEYAFYECDNLTKLNISQGVTDIAEGAFYYCEGLQEVIIGNSVTKIGAYAFYDCGALTYVRIGAAVEAIGEYAFANTSLTAVDFIDKIGWNIFEYYDVDENEYGQTLEKLTSTALADAKKAAELLSNTYAECYWERKNTL